MVLVVESHPVLVQECLAVRGPRLTLVSRCPFRFVGDSLCIMRGSRERNVRGRLGGACVLLKHIRRNLSPLSVKARWDKPCTAMSSGIYRDGVSEQRSNSQAPAPLLQPQH